MTEELTSNLIYQEPLKQITILSVSKKIDTGILEKNNPHFLPKKIDIFFFFFFCDIAKLAIPINLPLAKVG